MIHLFPSRDAPFGENNDAEISIYLNNFCHAIGVTRVVDVPSQAS